MNNQIAKEFIKAINEKDIEKMASMMTDDHLFIDALGKHVRGKAEMKKAWTEYFHLFPDYQINTTMIYEGANSVALFGYVGESPKIGQGWQIPASFEAVIENGKIKIWSVIADTKTQSDIISQKQVGVGKTIRKVTQSAESFSNLKTQTN